MAMRCPEARDGEHDFKFYCDQPEGHCYFCGKITKEANVNTIYYLVETDHGKLGTSIEGERTYSREKVVEQLAESSAFRVVKVSEVNETAGTWRDVSKEFAQSIADHLHASREPASYELRTWLQQHLGVTSTHSLVVG